MLRRICTVQIQPRRHILYHAHYTAPARQHELDLQIRNLSTPLKDRDHQEEIDYLGHDLSEVRNYHESVICSTSPLILRYRDDTGPGQISCLGKGVFHTNFSTTAPDFLMFLYVSSWVSCGALSYSYSCSCERAGSVYVTRKHASR